MAIHWLDFPGNAGRGVLKEDQQVPIILLSQVANGILLPFVVIFMLQLTNREDIMGKYKNSRVFNIIAWATCIVMIVLTAMLAISTFLPGKLTGQIRKLLVRLENPHQSVSGLIPAKLSPPKHPI